MDNDFKTRVGTELEMQRRALVSIKSQRDIDRNRRLMLIRKFKKEQENVKKLKIIVVISLSLSIISLFIKL